MPLRTLSYQVRIWNRFRKAYPTTPLPPIVVVLVSHVRGGWTRARSLGELFDPLVPATPALAQLVPDVPLIVEDLAIAAITISRAGRCRHFPSLRCGCCAMLAIVGACLTTSTRGLTHLERRSVGPTDATRSPRS